MSSQISAVTETGDVTTRDTYLRSVALAAGSDAATVTVKAGGSGGATVLVLSAVATGSASAELHDAFCGAGVHAALTGTGPTATFVYG